MSGQGGLLVGFELTGKSSQISVWNDQERDALSVPCGVGSGRSRFPTALFRSTGDGTWHFGLEAAYDEGRSEGIAVRMLLDKAMKDSSMLIEGKQYHGTELLAEFFRAALGLLGTERPSDAIRMICVTSDAVDDVFASAVRKALSGIGFKNEQILIAPSDECFYTYVYAERPEYRTRGSLLFDFDEDGVRASSLSEYRVRKPALVQTSVIGYRKLPREVKERDPAFGEAIREWTGGKSYSSIFLTGEGFGKEWAKESLPLLSRAAAHIFAGDNLYVKGACLLAGHYASGDQKGGAVFRGSESVPASLYLQAEDRGKTVTLALLREGDNRFFAGADCELMLNDEETLSFTAERAGETGQKISLPLSGIPKRPARASRIALSVRMKDRTRALIRVTDLGFGELYPSSGKVWETEAALMREDEDGRV